MSLTRLAMRLAAARALRDRTLAGARVFDSAVDPIDQTIAETRQPLLVLTTDEHALDVTGRDLSSGAHRCDLVIEIAIASRVEVPASDGDGGQISIAIPHTDEGMELTLDIMEHQVTRALTRDDTAWSRAWMKLVPRITRRLSRRGAVVRERGALRRASAGVDLRSGGHAVGRWLDRVKQRLGRRARSDGGRSNTGQHRQACCARRWMAHHLPIGAGRPKPLVSRWRW